MNSINRVALAKSMVSRRKRKNKYGAMRTIVDGLKFDSRGECDRWLQLKLLERAGEICGLRRQVKFPLYAWTPSGKEQIGTYAADFQYRDMRTNREVTEDFKGCITAEFRRTQKLMRANYGIEILVTRK